MYAILAEDASDAKTLAVIVRRLDGDERLTIKPLGYGGCGKLLNKGARDLALFRERGFSRFVVCHDADGEDPLPAYRRCFERIVVPSGVEERCCVVVPVQELEAWLIADETAFASSKIIPRWNPRPVVSPESILNPKEHLIRQSRGANRKVRYFPATHNELVAQHLDLNLVAQKCPSFHPLRDFVQPQPKGRRGRRKRKE